MAQSHDSMVASIVREYVQPQEIYLLTNRDNDCPFMGYFRPLIEYLYNIVVGFVEESEYDEDDESDTALQKIIRFVSANDDVNKLTSTEMKLIIIEALKIKIIAYGNWENGDHQIFTSNPETGFPYELSLADVIELLSQ